jgi:DNA-binding protein Fis
MQPKIGLRHSIKLHVAAGPALLPEHLPATIRGERRRAASNAPVEVPALDRLIRERLTSGGDDVYAEVVEWVERRLLADAMKHTRGNLSKASRLLGISRPTLRAKLNALGVGDASSD